MLMHDPLSAFLYVRGLVPENATWDQIQLTTDQVRLSLIKLSQDLDSVTDEWTEEQIQSVFYEAGKIHFKEQLRWWFEVLYQVMLSEKQGPRLGQFTRLMTPYWVQDRIHQVLTDYWQPQEVAHEH
jgi:lysyl-tRNA synthetase class I